MPPWGHSKFSRLNEDDWRKLRYILENGIFQHNCYYVEFIIQTNLTDSYQILTTTGNESFFVRSVTSVKMRGPRSLDISVAGEPVPMSSWYRRLEKRPGCVRAPSLQH